MASSATLSITNGTRLLRNSDMRSTSAIKAIMSFMYEGVQLPDFLVPYAGFFTGLITGALAGSALYAYLQRNWFDRAKVKLAVYHVLRTLEYDASYYALIQDPQALMIRIDAEVMRLVGKHLTSNEVSQVSKDVKRSLSHVAAEEPASKRVRESERDVVKERPRPHLAPAYPPVSLRGFMDPPATEQPYNKYVHSPETEPFSITKSPCSTPKPPRCASPVQEPDEDFVHRECGLPIVKMDVDEGKPSSTSTPHVPAHLFGGRSRLPARHLTTPAAQQSIFVGRANRSTTVLDKKNAGYESEVDTKMSPEPSSSSAQDAEGSKWLVKPTVKKHEGYGLFYDDDEIYSSEEETALPVSHPPPVVRQCGGMKLSGNVLSPIAGSSAPIGGLPPALSLEHWSTKAELDFSSREPEAKKTTVLSTVHMSTQPELVYSSSEDGSDDEASGSPGAITTPSPSSATYFKPSVVAAPTKEDDFQVFEDGAGGSQTSEPALDQENVPPSPPSPKRKSPSSSPPSASKRIRTTPSPLADVTNSPTLRKKSRGRGVATVERSSARSPARTPAPASASSPIAMSKTPKKKTKKALAHTPATRKSKRLEKQKMEE